MRRDELLHGAGPFVAAPMAGGASSPRLVAAVAAAGGFPFLAAGYRTTQGLQADVAALRATGCDAFGVNLFAPAPVPVDPDAFRAYAARLQPDAARYGLDLTDAPLVEDDDGWQDTVRLLVDDPVPVVSVTFGVPPAADLLALQRAGSRVLLTVTSVEEARAAAAAGADGLVVQGVAAGGHSGRHDPRSTPEVLSTAELTRRVVRATGLPVVAAGGVDGPRAFAELLRAGAVGVAVGTLLLRTDESGASQVHRDALVDPRATTTVTSAFTGRPARALVNRFVRRHDRAAPLGYPAVHHLTRELRRRAAAAGEPGDVHLWAGTGHRAAPSGPAADVVAWLTGAAG